MNESTDVRRPGLTFNQKRVFIHNEEEISIEESMGVSVDPNETNTLGHNLRHNLVRSELRTEEKSTP